jgi:chemotaxis protein methyltransferase CheR
MEVSRLHQEIARRYGLRPRDRWDHDLGKALAELARRRGLPTGRLEAALLSDPRLLRELAGLLTIEETFFFRFPEQVSAVVQHLGERWWRVPSQDLVVWSAGCSTGEEPYSIAIALHDTFGPLARRCRVLACDLNTDAIARARAGVYGDWSFRGGDAGLRDRCFERTFTGRYQLHPTFRRAVQFEHLSIQEVSAGLADASVEVILFRNVGVYLDAPALARCHAEFARILDPGGLLIQAATDPLPPADRFGQAEADPVGVFRKGSRARTYSFTPSTPSRPSSRPPAPRAGPDTLRPPPHVEVLTLGDRGELERALNASNRVVEEDPSAPAGLVLRAQIHLAAGRAELAIDDLRRALFLAPDHWLTRYWYVVALRSADRADRAEGHIRDLLRELGARAETELLEDGITQVGEPPISRSRRLT